MDSIADTVVAAGDQKVPSATPNPAEHDLEQWLKTHDPNGPAPYAPTSTYCTKYVESVLHQGAGYDLQAKVAGDMAAHEPSWGPADPLSFKSDGYRYSSWLHRGDDAYDSDNVQNYFKNAGELHDWKGNQGMQVGDVLLLQGKGEDGLAHTAMVAGVDQSGHITQVAESTGLQVKIDSWSQFSRDTYRQGMQIVDFGRPDFQNGK